MRCLLHTRSPSKLLLLILGVGVFITCSNPEPPEYRPDDPIELPETPALLLLPADTTVGVNQSATMRVSMIGDTDELDVGAAYLDIQFDQSKLRITNVTAGGFFTGAAEEFFITETDNETGILHLYFAFLGDTLHSQTEINNMAFIIFETRAHGDASVVFDTDSCQIVNEDIDVQTIPTYEGGVIHVQ